MVNSAVQAPDTGVKPNFRKRMHTAREDAIIAVVNRLLAEKGFDAMTVDAVAAEVGIAKASLYRHFPSKEDLAAAAMAHVMARAIVFLNALDATQPPLHLLQAVVRWAMQLQLDGEMPSLPSENSSLRAVLMQHLGYTNGLLEISERLGAWIESAQGNGSLDATLPPIAILYTLYARACDPVLRFLKGTEQFSNTRIIELVMQTSFKGLCGREAAQTTTSPHIE
jgi:TetR/AcrR family transcriptional regulator, regulator of autoinduction and epiphytic fitness